MLKTRLALSLGIVALLILPQFALGQNAPTVIITEYTIPTPNAQPGTIVTGPDGALWFTQCEGVQNPRLGLNSSCATNQIGRISIGGTVTEYPLPAQNAPYGAFGITAGPDSALWFTTGTGTITGIPGSTPGEIGRMTTAGAVSEFPIPSVSNCSSCLPLPVAITAGPDGALWFTENGWGLLDAGAVGRVTAAGEVTAQYPNPGLHAYANQIAAGPGGLIWYTGGWDGEIWIASFTTTGTGGPGVLFDSYEDGETVSGITAGPDGGMWFAIGGQVGEVPSSGGYTQYPPESPPSLGPLQAQGLITTGPDGAIWFTETNGKIGRVTTTGDITEYPTPSGGAAFGITTGPDGALWFTETTADKIGRIQLSSSSSGSGGGSTGGSGGSSGGSTGGGSTGTGSTGPVITTGGVVSAASFSAAGSQGVLAAGEIVAIFGSNLAGSTASAQTLPLSDTLGGAQVTFNNISAPLFYASGGQINAQIPFGIPAGPLTVQVTSGGVSMTQAATMAAFSPGIFTLNESGSGQGAVLIGNSATLAAPAGTTFNSQPAQPGQYLAIYCTGLGPVSNPPAAGAAASADTLSQTTTAPTVTIGGVPATVSFSGLTPSLVGLYQVNVQIPANVPTGNAVSVALTIGGVTSNTVTVAIQASS